MTQLALIVAGLVAGGKLISGGFGLAGKAFDKLPSFKTLGFLAIVAMLFRHASNNEAFAQSCKNLLGGAYDSIAGFFSGSGKVKGAYETSDLFGLLKKLHNEGKLPALTNREIGEFERLLISANISIDDLKDAVNEVVKNVQDSLNKIKLTAEELKILGQTEDLGLYDALIKVQKQKRDLEKQEGTEENRQRLTELMKLEDELGKKIEEHMKTQKPAHVQVIEQLSKGNKKLEDRSKIGADSGKYYSPEEIGAAQKKLKESSGLRELLKNIVELAQKQSLTLDGEDLSECSEQEAKNRINEKRTNLDGKLTDLKKTEETLEAELTNIAQKKEELTTQLGDPKRVQALLTDDRRRKELVQALMKVENDVEKQRIQAELEKLDKLEKTQTELTDLDKKHAEISANLEKAKTEMKDVEKARADLDGLSTRVQAALNFKLAEGNLAPDYRQVEMYLKLQEAAKAKREELYRNLKFDKNDGELKRKCSPDCIALREKDIEEILKTAGADFSEEELKTAKTHLTEILNSALDESKKSVKVIEYTSDKDGNKVAVEDNVYIHTKVASAR